MPTTAAPPAVPVVVFVPAGAARLAADRLSAESRREEVQGDPALCEPFTVAAKALHAAGWREPLEDVTGELNAREDQPTLSAHLPATMVHALLVARGWTLCEQTERSRFNTPLTAGTYSTWTRPGHPSRADGGKFGDDYLWETDDALTLALAAEALAVKS